MRNNVDVIKGEELQVSDAVYAYQLDGKGGVSEIDMNCEASIAKPCWLHLWFIASCSMHQCRCAVKVK